MPPRIRFLFVRPAFCLGLPSDSPSRETPLPSASTPPCRACRGLSPPSHPEAPPSGTAPVRRCAPCLAHQPQKKPAAAGLSAGGPPERGESLRRHPVCSGSQGLDALVQAALQAGSLLLGEHVLVGDAVDDRLRLLESGHRLGVVTAVDGLDDALDVGADHAALAGLQYTTAFGLTSA